MSKKLMPASQGERMLCKRPAMLILKHCYLLLLFTLAGYSASAQQCTGSLGDPVFKETFGEAPTAAKPTLGPALAPGITTYTYYSPATISRPTGPYPGQYTISNTTRGYNNIYFVDRPDHTSTNGRGFCMVVDANATPDQFYERTITGLCAGSVFEFSAWIMNINSGSGGSDPSLRFDILDANNPSGPPLKSVSTGNVPYQSPGVWVRQAGIFQMPATTSAVILRIFSNTPSSNGNDLALDDIAFAACGPPITFTQAPGIVCSNATTSMTVSLPAGSYSHYYFQLEKRALGTTTWNNETAILDNGSSNSRTFSIPNARGGFEYRVLAAGGLDEINNANCRVVSVPVELKVVDFSVNINGNQTICYNTAPALTAAITRAPGSGTPAAGFTYRWETSPDGINNWTVISGQTNANLTVPPLTANAWYRVTATVSSCTGDGVSAPFRVTVLPDITATLQPVPAICQGATQFQLPFAVNSGNPDRFSAAATDLPGFTAVNNAVLTASPLRFTLPANTVPGTYHLNIRFTNTTSGCGSVTYPFTVKVDSLPTVANAGPNQTLCAATSTTMAANTPVAGTGTWSQTGGPNNAVFSNIHQPNTQVTGLITGTYNFRWTITNGSCEPSSANVSVTVTPALTKANAGPDMTQYNSGIFQLNANNPAAGETGAWAVIAGSATIGTASDPKTTATLNPNSSATLTWTISNGGVCPPDIDTVVLTFTSLADIRINKTISPQGPYLAGQPVTYRIEVTNAGPSTASRVHIRDILPAGYVPGSMMAAATGAARVLDDRSNTSSVDMDALIPTGDASIIIEAEGKIAGNFSGDLTNTATATSLVQRDPDGATSTVTVPVARRPYFEQEKSAPATAVAGETIQFVLSTRNTSLSDALDAAIKDSIDARIQNVSWTATTTGGVRIRSGAAGTGNKVQVNADFPGGSGMLLVTITGTITPDATGKIDNQGSVTPAEPFVDPFISNVTDTRIISSPGLVISKSKVAPVTAIAGEPIAYEILLVNNGPSNAAGTVITDTVPAMIQQVQWTTSVQGAAAITAGSTGSGNIVRVTGNIPAGGSNIIRLQVTGVVSPSFAGNILNMATATPTEPGIQPVTDIDITPVRKSAALHIVKSGPDTATAGEKISYTIDVDNNGPSAISNASITDMLPPELTGVSWITTVLKGTAAILTGATGTGNQLHTDADMSPGSTIRIVVRGTILPTATAPLRNTAAINPSEPNLQPVTSNIVITQLRQQARLFVTKAGPDSASAGNSIVYTIEVGNNGPSNARAVHITDVVPASVQQVTWSARATGNASITGTSAGSGNSIALDADISAGAGNVIVLTVNGVIAPSFQGTLTNKAVATPSGTGNRGDSASKSTIVSRIPQLSISKAAVDEVIAGDSLKYHIEIGNTGVADAVNALFTDIVPAQLTGVTWFASTAGTATINGNRSGTGNSVTFSASIPAGAGNKIFVTITGKTDPAFEGIITNTAAIQPAETPQGVFATKFVTVRRVPVLKIVKSGPAQSAAGNPVVYKLLVNNPGKSNATGVVINDIIPAEVRQVSWTTAATGGAVVTNGATGTGNTLQVTANIPGGGNGTVEITINGKVSPSFSGTFENYAIAVPAETGTTPDTSNKILTTVERKPVVSIIKRGPEQVNAGDIIYYDIIVSNTGPSEAQQVVITDQLAPWLQEPDWEARAFNGSTIESGGDGNKSLVRVVGNIGADSGKIIVSVAARVPYNTQLDSVLNQAMTTGGAPGLPPVISGMVRTKINHKPNVVIVKTGPAALHAGEMIHYIIRVTNFGPSLARGTVISDVVPAAVENVTWTANAAGSSVISSGSTGTGNTVNLVADMPPGQENELTITVTGTVKGDFSGQLVNTATASPAEPGIAQVKDDAVTTVDRSAVLQISKAGPATMTPGNTVSYTMEVTNAGPSNANNIRITDNIPAAILSPTWGALALNGATITSPATGSGAALSFAGNIPATPEAKILVQITGTLDPDYRDPSLTNQAIVINDPSIPGALNDTSAVTSVVQRLANLRIVKSGPANGAAGETIQYVLRVQNDGPSNVRTATITDILPASILNVSWTATPVSGVSNVTPAAGTGNNLSLTADMNAGGILDIVVNGVISPATVNGATIINTATVALPAGSTATDPNPADNTSTVSTVTDNDPVVRIAKTGPATVNILDSIHYRIEITNGGSGNITNALITDNVPAGITVGRWTATATGTATVTGAASGTTNTVSTTADIPVGNNKIIILIDGIVNNSAGTSVTNTATVTAGANKTSSVTTTVNRSLDAGIVKSGPQQLLAGQQIAYSMQIFNNGPTNADSLVITDIIPAEIVNVSWRAQVTGNGSVLDSMRIDSAGNNIHLTARLAAGAGNYITISVIGTVSGSTPAGSITNTATVTAIGTTDYNPANNTSSITTVIGRDVGLLIRKGGPVQTLAGNRITYGLVITNQGPSDATGINISDLVPAAITNTRWAVTVTGAAAVTGPFNGTGNNMQTTADIPAGKGNSVIVTITGTVAPGFSGNITNIGTAGGTGLNTVTDTVHTRVVPQSALNINKTGAATVTAGDNISYVITASNSGPSLAKGVTVTDTLDSRIKQVTWTATGVNGAVINSGSTGTGNLLAVNADIPAGNNAVITINISGIVPDSATGSLRNTATADSPDSLTVPVVTPPVITNIEQHPQLAVVKNGPSAIAAGENINYVLQVMNNGLSTARNAVITDQIPAAVSGVQWAVQSTSGGAVILSGGNGAGNSLQINASLPPHAAIIVAVSGKVDSTFTGKLINTLIATPSEPGNLPDTAEVETDVLAEPSLQITKAGADTVIAGQAVTYTITVKNNGPSAARRAVIADPIAPGLTQVRWSSITTGQAQVTSGGTGTGNQVQLMADIPPGDAHSVVITVSGVLSSRYRDSLRNIATVTSAETGETDTAGIVAHVKARPVVQILKSGPDTVNAGQSIRYVITVTNNGPSDASQLRITDAVPSTIQQVNWEAVATGTAHITGGAGGSGNNIAVTGDIAAGSGNNITITVTGTIPAGASGRLVNTAEVVPSEDSTLRQSSSRTTIIRQVADITISKTGPQLMVRGARVTYVVIATNLGPSDAINAVITDLVPAVLTDVSWNVQPFRNATINGNTSGTGNNVSVSANLPAADNSGVQLLIEGVVKKDAPAGTVTNTATVRQPDGTTATSLPVVSRIGSSADVSIRKTGPASVFTGNKITYQLEVANNGPSDAPGTIVTDSIPAGLSQINTAVSSMSGGAGNIQFNTINGNIQATIGQFPSGAAAVLTITGTAGEAGTLRNTAGIVPPAGITDPDSSNNRSTVSTQVQPKVPLDVTKSVSPASGIYEIGQTVTYTLRISNQGAAGVNPLTVTDTLPPAALAGDPDYQSPPRGTATYNAGQRLLTWNATELKPGETLTWSYRLTIRGAGAMRNIAIVTGPPDVAIPDTSTITITTGRYANLKVTKALETVPPLVTGQVLTFSITAANNGPDTATGVIVKDVLAPVLGQPITISDGGTYNAGSSTISWSLPAMPPGASRKLTFTVRLLSGSSVPNTATIAGNETDIDLSDNTFTIVPVPVSGDDIFIPNVITPNGDGKNDNFRITGLEKYPGSSLYIYNRWGNQVYQTKDYDNKWQGTGLNEGTYFYILKLKIPAGGEREYKGWILLVR
ncbi:DUF11 domain-containing protein [Chitinophaga sp. Mgbs1]|uniref:DUF11 domain-containing protein n=1 Tax=Chitinophaga solisilvae TaxID=1233460 RepID=A0A433WFP2_9BACT|nr:DUF11 domain-containing protein [Chitinophaga solisilvae]